MRSPPAVPARGTPRSRALDVLLASAAVLVVWFVFFPDEHSGFWVAMTAWSVVAMVYGTRVHRPPRPLAWYLLTLAAAGFSISNATDFASLHHPAALPHALDWLELAAYVPAYAGLLLMMRHRLADEDRGGQIDAVIAVSAGTFVVWVYLIMPYVHGHETLAVRLAAIAPTVGDLLLLGVFARLLAPPAARITAVWLLFWGTVAMTVADVLDSLWRLHSVDWFDTATRSTLLESGWVVFAFCWAAAALAPSMRQTTRPVPTPSTAVGHGRLAALAVAAVITPAVVTVQLIRDDDTTGWFGPLLATVVFLMILARVGLVVGDHRRALAREAVLLDASGSLAAAAGAAEVAAALATASTGLMPRQAAHAAVVVVQGEAAGAEAQVTMSMAGLGGDRGGSGGRRRPGGGGGDGAAGGSGEGSGNGAGADGVSGNGARAGGGSAAGRDRGRPGRHAAGSDVGWVMSRAGKPALTSAGEPSTAPYPPGRAGPPGPVTDAAELDSATERLGHVRHASSTEATAHPTSDSAAHPAHPADPSDPADPVVVGGTVGPDTPAWAATLVRLAGGVADAEWRAAVTRQVAPVRVAELPPTLARCLDRFPYALVLPLGTEIRPEEPWAAGVLAVATDEAVLVPLSSSLDLLARQAALTLHRIALGQEIARRDGEAYFRALVQNTNDAVLIVDSEQRVRYASPSASSLFDRASLLGLPLAELIGPGPAGEVAGWAADPATREPVRRDWEVGTPSGIPHEVEATIADLRQEPTVCGFVLSLHDVTTARGLERTLQRHAYHDPLTGLPNRLAFSRGLDDALELASPDVSVSVVLLNLDNFREANDVHGRESGDEVLRATAGLLRDRLLPGDVLARTGGDEFAILQVRHTSDTPTLPLGMPGEQRPYFVGPIAVTTSGAVATAGPDATGASLLADAEMTLHAARSASGSRRWRRYDPELRVELARAAARRSGLDRALLEETFQLFYQPIVSLHSGDVIAFEALIRWPQEDGSLLPPDEFIPLAEATGQILPLGRWIMRTATRQAALWNQARAAHEAPPVKVSVNVSAHELRDPAFAAAVTEAAAAAGLSPDLLVLEATESSLIHHAGAVRANLRMLTQLGIRVALDDFGTGYSSLSYLRDLPVNSLKIDKLFVDGVPSAERQTALVEGIIGIAKSLHLRVIAEGIETGEQCEALTAMGADDGQGYLFAKPLPAAEASRMMSLGPLDLLPHRARGRA